MFLLPIGAAIAVCGLFTCLCCMFYATVLEGDKSDRYANDHRWKPFFKVGLGAAITGLGVMIVGGGVALVFG